MDQRGTHSLRHPPGSSMDQSRDTGRAVASLPYRECSNQHHRLKIGVPMTEKKARSLELFYKPTCPFCQKVLVWMKDHDVENVTLYDISTDSEAADLSLIHI